MEQAAEVSRPKPPRTVSLTRTECNRATAMFDEMDRNHDGVVDIIEFQAVMEQVATRTGKPYSFENVRRMFLEADANGDGVIDYDEWMDVQKRQKARKAAASSSNNPTAAPNAGPAACAAACAAAGNVRISDMNEDDTAPQWPRAQHGSAPSSAHDAAPSSAHDAAPSTLESLREMLASLASTSQDPELKREAEYLLNASLDSAQERQRREQAEADEEDTGTLPLASTADARHRAMSMELAARLAATQPGSVAAAEGGLSRVVSSPRPVASAALAAEPEEEEEEEEEDEEDDEEMSTERATEGRGSVARGTAAAKEAGVNAAMKGGSASSALSGVSLSSVSAPLEILVAQSQFTGLSAGILASMAKHWDLK